MTAPTPPTAMRAGLLTALAWLMVLPATVALAQQRAPRQQRVLIGFKAQPGATEHRLVQDAAGRTGYVRYRYRVAPVIAAEVPESAIAALQRNPRVAYVEADSLVWALQQEIPWGVDQVDAEWVWPTGNTATGIRVATIDSGIDLEHPDLWDNYAGGYDFVEDDDYPDDDYGHGTHVAGTIAAMDNDFGVVGVAPGASLYVLKVLDSDGLGYTSDVIAAIDLCRQGGIDIANMSLGGAASRALENACRNAYNDGVLLVAAAGNDGRNNISYPARYDSVIAVGATDSRDRRTWWSSYGGSLELVAPGVNILSTVPGGYESGWSGTSMAAPHVSGVAALAMAAHPDASTVEIRAWLAATALDLGAAGWDRYYGYGRVDAFAAAAPPPVLVSITVSPDTATVDVGQTRQFSASGTYEDGSLAEISAEVEWISSDPTVATISGSGLAEGIAEGTATIWAAAGEILSNGAVLSVTAPQADTVQITRAQYSSRYRRLTVEATSSGAPTAVLRVYCGDGSRYYGTMRYNSRSRRYTLTANRAADPGGSVRVVSSLGGSDTAEVSNQDSPPTRRWR